MLVTAFEHEAFGGSIVIFHGEDDRGRPVRFGVDHRIAQDLAEFIEAEGPIDCEVEDWQVI